MGTFTTNFKVNNLDLGTYFANSGGIYNSNQNINFKKSDGVDIGNYLIPISVGTKVSQYPTGDVSYYKHDGTDLATVYKIRKYTCMREMSYSIDTASGGSLNISVKYPGVFDSYQVGAGGNGGSGNASWWNDGGGGGGGGGACVIAIGVIPNSNTITISCGSGVGGSSTVTAGSIMIKANGGANGGRGPGGSGGAGGTVTYSNIDGSKLIARNGGNGGRGGKVLIGFNHYPDAGYNCSQSNTGYLYNGSSIYFPYSSGGSHEQYEDAGGGGGGSQGNGGNGSTSYGCMGSQYGGGGGGGGCGELPYYWRGKSYSGGPPGIGICKVYINNPNITFE